MTEKRRSIGLSAVRADGWFERLGEGSPNFRQLCEVVGERFVAFSVIAGVRIMALTIDRQAPDATLVDFGVGDDDAEQRLPLGEFRRRLVSALLEDDPLATDLPDDPKPEEVQSFIGFRYVLLAPIFGLRLVELRVGGGEPAYIVVNLGGATDELPVEDFRDIIRERIRAELARARPQSPFSIDLAAIPEAERAVRAGDYDLVVKLLGAWPGPLSLLLRTAEGQRLAPDVRATLARSLGYLGSAYVKKGRFDWAEEVMRLGIQWAQDGPAAGDLFRRMGESCVVRGRYGEAIGLLRRAVSLGAANRDVLPLLARSYAERERWVAAAVCAEEAISLGSEVEDMQAILDQATQTLGAPWVKLRQTLPSPTTMTATIPAPAMDHDAERNGDG